LFHTVYFGESFDESKCENMCDNCADPMDHVEAKDEMLLLLRTVLAVKEKHQMKHVVNVLLGKETAEVKTYNHDELDMYGEGDEKDIAFWNSLIRHGLVQGLVHKEIETYGQLKLTENGRDFLKNPSGFKLFLERTYEGDATTVVTTGGRGGSSADPELMKLLLDLRKRVAKAEDLSPYIIFQESSLEDMALRYPTSIEELKSIVGVGAGKAEKFGEPFIELISEYVEENEIERPMDLVVKSVANKSANKVHIISNIDKRLPLEDIGRAKGLEMEDLLTEIESIVYSGTKVNINYYLDDILDEDSQEEIFDYFRESEDDDIRAAEEEFDGDFTEEELRLVRIRFMSEVAN